MLCFCDKIQMGSAMRLVIDGVLVYHINGIFCMPLEKGHWYGILQIAEQLAKN
jgi:hypothetical protein